MAEFDGVRATMYRDALQDYPEARATDIDLMQKHFKPQSSEVVLEVGAGNGIFSGDLADSVKRLYVADPSAEQLAGVDELQKNNIEVISESAENIDLPDESIDGIWSFGAIHHVSKKNDSFENFHRMLKPGGRLIVGDVFVGSDLAKHFDDKVAKYCETGHEVSFLSREYAETLCCLNGFEESEFLDFNASWKFKNKQDIGDFLYKLHAMTKTSPKECLEGAEEILGIEEREGLSHLNWPMTMLKTTKKASS